MLNDDDDHDEISDGDDSEVGDGIATCAVVSGGIIPGFDASSKVRSATQESAKCDRRIIAGRRATLPSLIYRNSTSQLPTPLCLPPLQPP